MCVLGISPFDTKRIITYSPAGTREIIMLKAKRNKNNAAFYLKIVARAWWLIRPDEHANGESSALINAVAARVSNNQVSANSMKKLRHRQTAMRPVCIVITSSLLNHLCENHEGARKFLSCKFWSSPEIAAMTMLMSIVDYAASKPHAHREA